MPCHLPGAPMAPVNARREGHCQSPDDPQRVGPSTGRLETGTSFGSSKNSPGITVFTDPESKAQSHEVQPAQGHAAATVQWGRGQRRPDGQVKAAGHTVSRKKPWKGQEPPARPLAPPPPPPVPPARRMLRPREGTGRPQGHTQVLHGASRREQPSSGWGSGGQLISVRGGSLGRAGTVSYSPRVLTPEPPRGPSCSPPSSIPSSRAQHPHPLASWMPPCPRPLVDSPNESGQQGPCTGPAPPSMTAVPPPPPPGHPPSGPYPSPSAGGPGALPPAPPTLAEMQLHPRCVRPQHLPAGPPGLQPHQGSKRPWVCLGAPTPASSTEHRPLPGAAGVTQEEPGAPALQLAPRCPGRLGTARPHQQTWNLNLLFPVGAGAALRRWAQSPGAEETLPPQTQTHCSQAPRAVQKRVPSRGIRAWSSATPAASRGPDRGLFNHKLQQAGASYGRVSGEADTSTDVRDSGNHQLNERFLQPQQKPPARPGPGNLRGRQNRAGRVWGAAPRRAGPPETLSSPHPYEEALASQEGPSSPASLGRTGPRPASPIWGLGGSRGRCWGGGHGGRLLCRRHPDAHQPKCPERQGWPPLQVHPGPGTQVPPWLTHPGTTALWRKEQMGREASGQPPVGDWGAALVSTSSRVGPVGRSLTFCPARAHEGPPPRLPHPVLEPLPLTDETPVGVCLAPGRAQDAGPLEASSPPLTRHHLGLPGNGASSPRSLTAADSHVDPGALQGWVDGPVGSAGNGTPPKRPCHGWMCGDGEPRGPAAPLDHVQSADVGTPRRLRPHCPPALHGARGLPGVLCGGPGAGAPGRLPAGCWVGRKRASQPQGAAFCDKPGAAPALGQGPYGQKPQASKEEREPLLGAPPRRPPQPTATDTLSTGFCAACRGEDTETPRGEGPPEPQLASGRQDEPAGHLEGLLFLPARALGRGMPQHSRGGPGRSGSPAVRAEGVVPAPRSPDSGAMKPQAPGRGDKGRPTARSPRLTSVNTTALRPTAHAIGPRVTSRLPPHRCRPTTSWAPPGALRQARVWRGVRSQEAAAQTLPRGLKTPPLQTSVSPSYKTGPSSLTLPQLGLPNTPEGSRRQSLATLHGCPPAAAPALSPSPRGYKWQRAEGRGSPDPRKGG
ncbi:collagen alpha-1(I) chain-like [Suricata suricatta]|uniref:collagen alpha-1(I) chain-like n=1 Tax=Suricata suricatta TaxID=37032 RepID=UPI001155D205|nr:collagen alpha-1(I) chain-like [Suricata suricatta]